MGGVVTLQPDHAHVLNLIGGFGCAWLGLHFLSYLLLSPLFNKLLDGNPKIAGDKRKKERAISQMLPRVVCFIHNVVQVPLALIILTDPYFYNDTALARDSFSTLIMTISAGYFLYDTLECIVNFKTEGPEFLLHGVVCFSVYVSLSWFGVMHWFGAGFLLWELSTPFMHFRWFLYKIGRDTSPLYTYNALAGFCMFGLCRMVWGPILSLVFWVVSFRALQDPAKSRQLPLPLVNAWRVCSVVLNGLNTYWFTKMVQIALAHGKEVEKTA